jgi:hypothetical protein
MYLDFDFCASGVVHRSPLDFFSFSLGQVFLKFLSRVFGSCSLRRSNFARQGHFSTKYHIPFRLYFLHTLYLDLLGPSFGFQTVRILLGLSRCITKSLTNFSSFVVDAWSGPFWGESLLGPFQRLSSSV